MVVSCSLHRAARSGLAMALTRNFADAIDNTWHPEKPSIFYVVDRHNGGLVAKYKVIYAGRT